MLTKTFDSAWLNVVPSKNLGLKLTDWHLSISLSHRLGAKICKEHTCGCGKVVAENGHQALSWARSTKLKFPVKQVMSSINPLNFGTILFDPEETQSAQMELS